MCMKEKMCLSYIQMELEKDKEIRINFIPVIKDGLIPAGTPGADVFL